MEYLGYALAFFVLGLVILVHEYGHYVAMRLNGVEVIRFTIGFGPTLWETKLKSGTIFAIKLIWLGGYTQPVEKGPRSVDAQSGFAQFQFYMAGMFANALAGFVALAAVSYYMGGTLWFFAPFVKSAPEILQPLWGAYCATFGVWFATPYMLFDMIASQGMHFTDQAAGPVGILALGASNASQASVEQAVVGYVFFFGMINGAIAGMNLIPILPLDGGHILFLPFKKAGLISKQTYQTLCIIGFMLIITLIVIVTRADLLKF